MKPLQLIVSIVLSTYCSLHVDAVCPNYCSGHGICGDYDICKCFNNPDGSEAWTGYDCSKRTCPMDIAWIGHVVKSNDVHPMAECSNKGICDRYTGFCECFPNFEGIACERTVCNNDCSMQGVCYTASQLAEEAGREYSTPWDANKNTGCVCDIGFRGPDCSMVECPSGPDVMRGFGNEAGRDCSGRGLCNYSTGVCECFQGYAGTLCNRQTILE
mmetsp:Transcript_10940/g.16482  ORF Transcript_10940/g.16482 Transcript_10940/m.16482 type:complete len:215 (+) Transcript_10940:21-665(+)